MTYDSVLTQFKTLNHLTLSSHQTPFDHRRSHLCQLPLRRSSRTQILVEATLYIWTGRIIAVCCAFCILANDLGWRVTFFWIFLDYFFVPRKKSRCQVWSGITLGSCTGNFQSTSKHLCSYCDMMQWHGSAKV